MRDGCGTARPTKAGGLGIEMSLAEIREYGNAAFLNLDDTLFRDAIGRVYRIKGPVTLTDIQKQILDGHLLGDGHLFMAPKNRTPSLSVTRKLSDEKYLLWTARHFEYYLTEKSISKRNYYDRRTNKIYRRIIMRTRHSPAFLDHYRKWYENRIKVLPTDFILTPLTIAVWFGDDGSVSNRTRRALEVKFSTHCFMEEEVYRLEDILEAQFGRFSVYREKDRDQYTLRATTKTAKRVFQAIDSIFPPLERKSSIWRREGIDLWNTISYPSCPSCGSNNVYKNGNANGKSVPKFYCKDCHRQFLRPGDYGLHSAIGRLFEKE